MLYILKNRQVIVTVKGTAKTPVVTWAYWADTDQDLTVEEVDALYIECAAEIKEAASIYHNSRVEAGDRRDY